MPDPAADHGVPELPLPVEAHGVFRRAGQGAAQKDQHLRAVKRVLGREEVEQNLQI